MSPPRPHPEVAHLGILDGSDISDMDVTKCNQNWMVHNSHLECLVHPKILYLGLALNPLLLQHSPNFGKPHIPYFTRLK